MAQIGSGNISTLYALENELLPAFGIKESSDYQGWSKTTYYKEGLLIIVEGDRSRPYVELRATFGDP
ncbi:MAG: hypothetical protein ABL962_10955 [Fimbriimonadaceae bacterium]